MPTPKDPLSDGIAAFGRRLRDGKTTSEAATRAYLDRIEIFDPRLGAFQHVAHETALASARALDLLLTSGVDLGPLMGVPVAIKDLFAVAGMPTTAGSKLDVTDLIGPEGSFVRKLKRLGCVVLGKTKLVEFAFGITGASSPLGTPRNPYDIKTPRLPGGSSSGSAVAIAAGLCGFAIGSDTGGSVRVPAALCGVFGLKTTHGLWSIDGVFPLAPHLDTIGLLTRNARDAALVYAALCSTTSPHPVELKGLRLALPGPYFFRNLDAQVERRIDQAMNRLALAGCALTEVEMPEPSARETYFPLTLAACLVAALGEERIKNGRNEMDPVVARRADAGIEAKAADLLRLEWIRHRLQIIARERMAGIDAWIAPTTTIVPPPIASLDDPTLAMALTLGMTQNSQPANYLDLCATTLPIDGGNAPVGLQIMCSPRSEPRLLGISCAVENALAQ